MKSVSLCETLRKKCAKAPANPSSTLSNFGHTRTMDPKSPARSVWIFLAVFLALAWAAIVFLAIQVSETVLAMLRYVVDLAQLY
jgi:hypothetical protein